MRTFKVGFVTLTASAAVLIAADTVAAPQRVPNATPLSMTCTVPLPCFDLYEDGSWIDNADIATAATFCGVSPAVLLVIQPGQWIVCSDPARRIRRAECVVVGQLAVDSPQGQAVGARQRVTY